MALDNALKVLRVFPEEKIEPSGATLIAPDVRTVEDEYVAGNSGTYLIERDAQTGEIVRDDRPWQMREGVS